MTQPWGVTQPWGDAAVKRTLPVIGALCAAGGVLLLGWTGWSALRPVPAPYSYRLVAEGASGDFPQLGLSRSDLALAKYEVRAEGVDSPVAVAHVAARAGAAPVLLDWRNEGAEPVLRLGAGGPEVATLAAAVAEHAPADAVVLAWWDTSRQLRLLAGANVLFDDNLASPLLLPAPWRAARVAIEALERDFWKVPPAQDATRRFDALVDALVADVPTGLARLRELAGPGRAFVVIHVSDVYRVGALRPERLGVGYKDFRWSAQSHGTINSVKSWLREKGYSSYTVERRGDDIARVYFLTNAASERTLVAQLLPFTTSAPVALEAPQVVYQQGGYWVYQLSPEEPARAARSGGGS